MRETGRTGKQGTRGHVDDLAATAPAHVRHRRLAHQEWTARVDRKHAVELRRLDLLERPVAKRGQDRGVVDQTIDPAQARRDAVDRHPHGPGVGNIELDLERFRARISTGGRDRAQLLRVDVDEGQPRALEREATRVGAADPGSRPGDDDDTVLEPAHGVRILNSRRSRRRAGLRYWH